MTRFNLWSLNTQSTRKAIVLVPGSAIGGGQPGEHHIKTQPSAHSTAVRYGDLLDIGVHRLGTSNRSVVRRHKHNPSRIQSVCNQ